MMPGWWEEFRKTVSFVSADKLSLSQSIHARLNQSELKVLIWGSCRKMSEGDLHSKQPVGEFNLLATDLLWVCKGTLYEASRLSWMPVQAPMSPSASRIWRAICAPNSWIRSTVIPGYPLGNLWKCDERSPEQSLLHDPEQDCMDTSENTQKMIKFTLFYLILNSFCTWKNKKWKAR